MECCQDCCREKDVIASKSPASVVENNSRHLWTFSANLRTQSFRTILKLFSPASVVENYSGHLWTFSDPILKLFSPVAIVKDNPGHFWNGSSWVLHCSTSGGNMPFLLSQLLVGGPAAPTSLWSACFLCKTHFSPLFLFFSISGDSQSRSPGKLPAAQFSQ